jgi:hypothetical protein
MLLYGLHLRLRLEELELLGRPLHLLCSGGLPLPLIERPASLGTLLVLHSPLLRVSSGLAFFVAAAGCAATGMVGTSSATGTTSTASSALSPMVVAVVASSVIL